MSGPDWGATNLFLHTTKTSARPGPSKVLTTWRSTLLVYTVSVLLSEAWVQLRVGS